MDSREPREDHEPAAENRHLIVKRGLYFRPNDHGYTGLKREAGRYPASHADAGSGETAIHEDEAPEYSPACWEETILADKDRQIAELQVALRRPSPVAESGVVAEQRDVLAMVLESRMRAYAASDKGSETERLQAIALADVVGCNEKIILSALRRRVAESTPTDATAVEAERDGDKCACFCPTDECQRVCTLDCPNAGARTPKES